VFHTPHPARNAPSPHHALSSLSLPVHPILSLSLLGPTSEDPVCVDFSFTTLDHIIADTHRVLFVFFFGLLSTVARAKRFSARQSTSADQRVHLPGSRLRVGRLPTHYGCPFSNTSYIENSLSPIIIKKSIPQKSLKTVNQHTKKQHRGCVCELHQSCRLAHISEPNPLSTDSCASLGTVEVEQLFFFSFFFQKKTETPQKKVPQLFCWRGSLKMTAQATEPRGFR